MAHDRPTRFTDRFGLTVPVAVAPMAMIAGPRLIAAVANAGGLGNVPVWHLPSEMARDLVRETRKLTDADLAVNIRSDLNQNELIAAMAEEGITRFNLFWGDPTVSAAAVHAAGGEVIATVGDVDGAKAALDAGAAAIIAQGVEAGGHVYGTTPLADLVAGIVEIAGDVPVVAAGGIVERADADRAFGWGASGVVLGTALIVTDEADTHPEYRRALLDATPGDTVLTTCFDGGWPDAPHRVLANSTYKTWAAAGSPAAGSRPGEGDVVAQGPFGMEIPRYSAAGASTAMSGEIEALALYAGTGVGRIADAHSVADVIRNIVGA